MEQDKKIAPLVDDLALVDSGLDSLRFVDTEDMIELGDDRYLFKDRRAGVINIGGFKVYPEEVESIINLHSAVRMSLIKARRNSIIGNLIVAYVVLIVCSRELKSQGRDVALHNVIFAACRDRLDRHKVPTMLYFAASLDLMGGGELASSHA